MIEGARLDVRGRMQSMSLATQSSASYVPKAMGMKFESCYLLTISIYLGDYCIINIVSRKVLFTCSQREGIVEQGVAGRRERFTLRKGTVPLKSRFDPD
jgi:hypothetical protein